MHQWLHAPPESGWRPSACLSSPQAHPAMSAGPAGGPAAPVDSALRGVVMHCLGAMCESGQQLVDLFVNYDCDLEVPLLALPLCCAACSSLVLAFCMSPGHPARPVA